MRDLLRFLSLVAVACGRVHDTDTGLSEAECGDGKVDDGEACDDGPDNGPGAACSESCQSAYCGNSKVDPGEQCDVGPTGDETCSSACGLLGCGDGQVKEGVEACDGGSGCTATCHFDVPVVPCADALCPYVVWSRGFIGRDAQVLAVAHDQDGAALLGGRFAWDLDLGGDELGTGVLVAPGTSTFVARMTSPTDIAWSLGSNTSGSSTLRALVRASDGGLLLAGGFDGAFQLGGPPLQGAGTGDLFVARLGPDGEGLWSARFGDNAEQQQVAAAISSSGDVFLAGSFAGTLALGGVPLVSAGDHDVFVARLSPDGAHRWSARYGNIDVQVLTDVAVDSSEAVIVTGYFRGQLDLGGGPLIAPVAHAAAFIGKLDGAGGHLWSRVLGGDGFSQSEAAPRLGVDGSDAIYLATGFRGVLDLGDGEKPANEVDVAVGRLAVDGAVVWSRTFGAAGAQDCDDFAVNLDGELALVGPTGGGIDFGGGVLVEPSSGYVARLGPDGEHRWSVAIPRTGGTFINTYAEALAIDDDGDVLVGGQYFGALPFGGAARVTGNPDERAAFIAELSPP